MFGNLFKFSRLLCSDGSRFCSRIETIVLLSIVKLFFVYFLLIIYLARIGNLLGDLQRSKRFARGTAESVSSFLSAIKTTQVHLNLMVHN